MKTNAPVKTRTGSLKESCPFNAEISAWCPSDKDCVLLPDGHRNALRVEFNRETRQVIRDKNGVVRYCAPWLMGGFFST